MTRLINIDNGGTLTDICVVDGDDVRYTKTLTTPLRPEPVPVRRPGQGVRAGSTARRGSPRCCRRTDYIRYSTTQGTNALVQRDRAAAWPARRPIPTLVEGARRDPATRRTCWRRWSVTARRSSSLDADDEALAAELVARVNDLAARGARPPGRRDRRRRRRRAGEAGSSGCCCGSTPGTCSARSRCCSPGSSWPTATTSAAPGRPCSTRSCTRRWSGSCSTRSAGCARARARRPLLIFRNDGGSSRVAKSAALKTYSSGPARRPRGHPGAGRPATASRHLLMVDVGGTTTDIGVVTDGAVQVDRRGPDRARCRRSFELAAITSHGVGGSSVFRVADGAPDGRPGQRGRRTRARPASGSAATEATITDVLPADRRARPGDLPGRDAGPAIRPQREGDPGQDRRAARASRSTRRCVRMEEAYPAASRRALADASRRHRRHRARRVRRGRADDRLRRGRAGRCPAR